MKCSRLLVFVILFSFFSCDKSCEKSENEIKKIMNVWYKRKIEFPKDVEILSLRGVHKNKLIEEYISKEKYSIVHFFTADCDKCINELKMIQTSLKKNSISSNVNYIFIASAPTKIYVQDAIKKTNFEYPIFYEKEYYSFKILNKLSVSEEIYNTMLLNENQELILFGAFYDNDKAFGLYSKAINCGL